MPFATVIEPGILPFGSGNAAAACCWEPIAGGATPRAGNGDASALGGTLVLSTWKLVAVAFASVGGTLRLASILMSGRLESFDRAVWGAGDAAVLPLDPPTWMVIFLAPRTGVSWPGVIFNLILGCGGSCTAAFAWLSSSAKHFCKDQGQFCGPRDRPMTDGIIP